LPALLRAGLAAVERLAGLPAPVRVPALRALVPARALAGLLPLELVLRLLRSLLANLPAGLAALRLPVLLALR
jgi:hypothetical protein